MNEFYIFNLIGKMTIKELLQLCQREIDKWNWDKTVYISSDDEWNEYHELLFAFETTPKDVEEVIKWSNTDLEDIKRYHKIEEIALLW